MAFKQVNIMIMRFLDFFKKRTSELFAGVPKSPNAFRANAKNVTSIAAAYSAIGAISDAIAGLPLNLYLLRNGKREIAHSHPLQKLIRHSPNKIHTPFSFIEAIVKSMLLYGNAYIYPILNGKNEVLSLQLLSPENVSLFEFADKIFYVYQTQTQKERLELDEIVNIPYFSTDGLRGLSPVAACRASFELALACEGHAKTFFENAARPSGVIKVPNNLSNEQQQRLAMSWKKAYSGAGVGNTAVLEGGASYEALTMPNKDAQFLELRQFQLGEIARIFNIPAHKIGDLSHATFSNIE